MGIVSGIGIFIGIVGITFPSRLPGPVPGPVARRAAPARKPCAPQPPRRNTHP
jgi:hypothetical protein